MTQKDIICLVCPVGCNVQVQEDAREESGYKVKGHECKHGKEYAINEYANPTRILTTTVVIAGANWPRLPVKTSDPIPRDSILDSMEIINQVGIKAPVKAGEVIIDNLVGTGVKVVATRSMERRRGK